MNNEKNSDKNTTKLRKELFSFFDSPIINEQKDILDILSKNKYLIDQIVLTEQLKEIFDVYTSFTDIIHTIESSGMFDSVKQVNELNNIYKTFPFTQFLLAKEIIENIELEDLIRKNLLKFPYPYSRETLLKVGAKKITEEDLRMTSLKN